MGGAASTRRVTFEADENENITVVKGIRVSDRGRAEGRRPARTPHSGLPGTAQPGSPRPGPQCCPARSRAACLQGSLKFQDSGRPSRGTPWPRARR